MNEEEARSYVGQLGVSRETMAALDRFVELIKLENDRQNLVAASTLSRIWDRHIADSAQLIQHAEGCDGPWIDLGSGPGLPGLVVAILSAGPMILVEERSRRAAFLRDAAITLGVAQRVTVYAGKVERLALEEAPSVISARAFAPLPRLLGLAAHLGNRKTRWILPKGRGAEAELAEAMATWQGNFRLVPSVTDSEAAIIIATDVRPRKSAR